MSSQCCQGPILQEQTQAVLLPSSSIPSPIPSSQSHDLHTRLALSSPPSCPQCPSNPQILGWAQQQAAKGLILSPRCSSSRWVFLHWGCSPKSPSLAPATLALSFPAPSQKTLQILQADLAGGWSKPSPRSLQLLYQPALAALWGPSGLSQAQQRWHSAT